jgi:hypothetical protein
MSGITASAALVIQAAVPAFADPPTAAQATEVLSLRLPNARAVDLDQNGSWLGRSFHIQKKSGFAYTHHFAMSDRPIVFRVQGPVMREQKALGLTFKIRF